ncbi:MAG: acetyl-CoA carboxylase biotin carboxyl carrier protein [Gammaproteobacteria bacterium]|nr:acetyl-CoA carboxylase biotin carboxyl carrier protein [Gammaproteobacteria bacterium]
MDLRKIKKLIELVQESGIAELEVRDGDESIRVARAVPGAVSVAAAPAVVAQTVADGAAPETESVGGQVVRAPISGTFYRSPAPGEAPFVREGDAVAPGDVLCIIESMKMMNRIEAELTGTVAEILLENGRAMESGTPLFRIA